MRAVGILDDAIDWVRATQARTAGGEHDAWPTWALCVGRNVCKLHRAGPSREKLQGPVQQGEKIGRKKVRCGMPSGLNNWDLPVRMLTKF